MTSKTVTTRVVDTVITESQASTQKNFKNNSKKCLTSKTVTTRVVTKIASNGLEKEF